MAKKKKLGLDQYLVPDPFWSRVQDKVARRITCPLLGHKWQGKMRGRLCRRCSIYDDRDMPTPLDHQTAKATGVSAEAVREARERKRRESGR